MLCFSPQALTIVFVGKPPVSVANGRSAAGSLVSSACFASGVLVDVKDDVSRFTTVVVDFGAAPTIQNLLDAAKHRVPVVTWAGTLTMLRNAPWDVDVSTLPVAVPAPPPVTNAFAVSVVPFE